MWLFTLGAAACGPVQRRVPAVKDMRHAAAVRLVHNAACSQRLQISFYFLFLPSLEPMVVLKIFH